MVQCVRTTSYMTYFIANYTHLLDYVKSISAANHSRCKFRTTGDKSAPCMCTIEKYLLYRKAFKHCLPDRLFPTHARTSRRGSEKALCAFFHCSLLCHRGQHHRARIPLYLRVSSLHPSNKGWIF